MTRETYLRVVLVFFIIAVVVEGGTYALLLIGINPFK
jgi:hypothetical protein